MPGRGVLAVDCSTKALGWAFAVHGSSVREFGLKVLPGMDDLPMLFAAVRNSIDDLVVDYNPRALAWCTAKFGSNQNTEKALGGAAAVLALSCWDHDLHAIETTDSHARLVVLGQGQFGKRDPARRNRIIKGTGTAAAKAAVMAWCKARRHAVATDDVGDALVLLECVLQEQRERA